MKRLLLGMVLGAIVGAALMLIILNGRRTQPSRNATVTSGTLDPAEIVRRFNILYYDRSNQTWGDMTWFGVPIQKYPTDMWIYQEIFYELKPDLVVEAGTFKGGSALYMAHLLDQLGNGSIITFDIMDWKGQPKHPRITYMLVSSTSREAEEAVKARIKPENKVLVVLDSDHTQKHVSDELKLYSKYVTPGSYLIVEDTNINGHPVLPGFGPGPMEAVEEFLHKNPSFQIDTNRERLMLTTTPGGFLRRMR